MKIQIESIPHSDQRYETCGDWWFDNDGTLQIRVSEMNPASVGAVAIHELVEVFLFCNGFRMRLNDLKKRAKLVDEFDMKFHGDGEPGDAFEAPYRDEHSIATAIERLLLAHIDLAWQEHETRVDGLFEKNETTDSTD